jgi:competence protein ComEA
MNKIKDLVDYIYYERKKIIIIIFVILTIITFLLFNNNKTTIKEEELVQDEVIEEKQEEKESKVMVDIKGEVVKPGLYEVDSDSRINDVIELAGGLKDDASTEDINLSSKVFDEMVIVINKKEEIKEKIESSKKATITYNSQTNNDTISKEETKVSGKVSLNNASIEELCTLNGIKEARAKKIIEYRTTNGPFKSIEEIKNVSGIGESIFAKIKDSITL